MALAGTRTVVSPPAVLFSTMKFTVPLLALLMPSIFPSRSTVRGCGLVWERELNEESGLSWCMGVTPEDRDVGSDVDVFHVDLLVECPRSGS